MHEFCCKVNRHPFQRVQLFAVHIIHDTIDITPQFIIIHRVHLAKALVDNILADTQFILARKQWKLPVHVLLIIIFQLGDTRCRGIAVFQIDLRQIVVQMAEVDCAGFSLQRKVAEQVFL